MKKFLSLLLILVIIVTAFSACSKFNTNMPEDTRFWALNTALNTIEKTIPELTEENLSLYTYDSDVLDTVKNIVDKTEVREPEYTIYACFEDNLLMKSVAQVFVNVSGTAYMSASSIISGISNAYAQTYFNAPMESDNNCMAVTCYGDVTWITLYTKTNGVFIRSVYVLEGNIDTESLEANVADLLGKEPTNNDWKYKQYPLSDVNYHKNDKLWYERSTWPDEKNYISEIVNSMTENLSSLCTEDYAGKIGIPGLYSEKTELWRETVTNGNASAKCNLWSDVNPQSYEIYEEGISENEALKAAFARALPTQCISYLGTDALIFASSFSSEAVYEIPKSIAENTVCLVSFSDDVHMVISLDRKDGFLAVKAVPLVTSEIDTVTENFDANYLNHEEIVLG
ncbi:MAG: hypothetical protein Q4C42_08330 [Clostridia bacterium]|nr:hypothetical protein [Clostridia bacterium]